MLLASPEGPDIWLDHMCDIRRRPQVAVAPRHSVHKQNPASDSLKHEVGSADIVIARTAAAPENGDSARRHDRRRSIALGEIGHICSVRPAYDARTLWLKAEPALYGCLCIKSENA